MQRLFFVHIVPCDLIISPLYIKILNQTSAQPFRNISNNVLLMPIRVNEDKLSCIISVPSLFHQKLNIIKRCV